MNSENLFKAIVDEIPTSFYSSFFALRRSDVAAVRALLRSLKFSPVALQDRTWSHKACELCERYLAQHGDFSATTDGFREFQNATDSVPLLKAAADSAAAIAKENAKAYRAAKEAEKKRERDNAVALRKLAMLNAREEKRRAREAMEKDIADAASEALNVSLSKHMALASATVEMLRSVQLLRSSGHFSVDTAFGSFTVFKTELTPLAAMYGYKIMSVGNGGKSALVKK